MKTKKKFRLIEEWNNNKGHVAWLFRLGKGFRKYTLGFLLISFAGMVISLLSSVAGKYVVDAATGFDTDLFWKYLALMIGTTLFTIALSFFSTLFSSYVGEKFAFGIRSKMFDKVQRSSWYEISKFHSADILSRLTSDISTVANSIITMVPTAIVAAVELVVVAAILIYYDPVMAIIGLVIGPLGVIAGALYRRKYIRYQKKLRESESEYYSFFQETLANLPITKTFQLEDRNNEYFGDVRDRRLSLVMKGSKLGALMGVVMKLIYNIGYVAAFSWCAYRLSNPEGGYTYGTMTLFLSLVSVLQGTISGLGSVVPQMISAIVSARRIREITDITSESYGSKTDIPKNVGVEFERVGFTYENEKVLEDVSFKVQGGERIAVIGSSGAGKTTLIRLLLSLVEPDKGRASYIIDGEKEGVAPDSRRFISYVPQGNTLISGTIRSNLVSANADATDEELWHALDLACAGDFVRNCADGIDTVLSEKAGGISEGQAQRIAIARAILRDRPVMILDEATSALDEDTERKIFERLSETKDKTCFIITHRKSMVEYCDRILEIDKFGRVTLKNKEE